MNENEFVLTFFWLITWFARSDVPFDGAQGTFFAIFAPFAVRLFCVAHRAAPARRDRVFLWLVLTRLGFSDILV